MNNVYLGGDTSLACSSQTAATIDAKVVAIVKEQHAKALSLLNGNKEKLG